MKRLFVVSVVTLMACGSDPVAPVQAEPLQVTSTKTVTCTNGQSAPLAVLQKTGRNIYTLNFCVSKTVTGYEGTVTRSSLQSERFVFDDPKAVWPMPLAEGISECLTTNNGDPLCYYPYL
jgi:hypothetical protein